MSTATAKIKTSLFDLRGQGFYLAVAIPFVIYVFIFNYYPLWSWSWSLFDYKPGRLLSAEAFVGLKHFSRLMGDQVFWLALRNTVGMAVLSLVFGTLSAIAFALLLNEARKGIFKRFTQTVSYLPHFVSWVVVAGLFLAMTKTIGTPGVLYKVLLNLGLVPSGFNIMMEKDLYWWVITLLGIWKETGWSAIIYLAAITAINPELYEAAYADGAGRMRRLWHITIPGIRSTIVILLVLNVGWTLTMGFEQRILFGNAANFDQSEVLGSYIYRWGLQSRNYSLAMAANVFQSLVSFFLVISANFAAKRINGAAVF